MREWQSVYEDSNEYRVDMVKAILEENGFSPVKIDKTISAYEFGNFEIHVVSKEVLSAIRVIKEKIKFE